MKLFICFALGFITFLALLQWYIIATREPIVRCDGGNPGA